MCSSADWGAAGVVAAIRPVRLTLACANATHAPARPPTPHALHAAALQSNIQKQGSPEDWRFREGATFAFGSILEGPSVETLAQLARSGLGFLLSALKDANPSVKNTTAWTIGARAGLGGGLGG